MSAAPPPDDRLSPPPLALASMVESSAACDSGADGIEVSDLAVDPRVRAAWRTWLSALATDADAAMAAALAYESLENEAREAWLDVLEQDAPGLGVPLVALYAPLLSVENDDGRRGRMTRAMAPASLGTTSRAEILAMRGVADDGSLVAVVVSPVYLHFVEVLNCHYRRDAGFVSVVHDPLRHIDEISTGPGTVVDGVVVEETPLRVVVEELAHAILAERRAGRAAPKALVSFVHIFGPDFEDGNEPSP